MLIICYFLLLTLVFFINSYSIVISLVIIELVSFALLLNLSFLGIFSFSFVFLLLFSLFVLLAVTGVLVYYSYVRFVGNDYIALSSIIYYYLSINLMQHLDVVPIEIL